MGRMRISVFVDYTADPIAVADWVGEVEAAGVDQVWVPEAYGFDAVSLLGYLAARTSRIELASGILPLGSRSATLLAMTAAGIDSLCGGRFTLGLGTSGPQVIEGMHGVAFDRPVARTRDTIEVCRMAWRREPLEYQGATLTLPRSGSRPLKLIGTPLRPRIPIAVAAMGPANVALTAELADGWLPLLGLFHPARASEVWGESLTAGRARRSPELGELDVVSGAELAIGPDASALRSNSRRLVAQYVGGMGSREANFYNDLFRRYGYTDEAAEIQDLYLNRQREEAEAAVPQEFLDATTLCGDRDYVAARVRDYADAGVTNLVVRAIGPDRIGSLRELRSIVDELDSTPG